MAVVLGEQDIKSYIHALANKHGVTYQPTATDLFGGHLTRLAGDAVKLDETQLLLLALRRAGHLTSSEAIELLGAYLSPAAS